MKLPSLLLLLLRILLIRTSFPPHDSSQTSGCCEALAEEGGGASGRIPLLRLLRVEFQSLPPPPPLFRWKTVEKGRLKEASSLLQRGEASEEGGRILRAVSRESRVGLRGGFCVFPPNFFSSPPFWRIVAECWNKEEREEKEAY